LIVVVTSTTPETNNNNGSIDITLSGGEPPFVYSWIGPNGFTSNAQDVSGLTAGTYSVTVTDGCSNSETITGINIQDATSLEEAESNSFLVTFFSIDLFL